jgi:prepilin-type N-terminal cleavage/methylation domain-containing protein
MRGTIMKSKKRGFTLPEMVVVLVIIALAFSVSTALVPSMDKARDTAKRLLCANGLRKVGAAMIMYADAYDNKMPTDRALKCGATKEFVDMHSFVVYRDDLRTCDTSVDPLGKLIPLRWACLFEAGLITEPNLFYCPNNKSSAYRYESYIDPPPWGTLPQNYNTRGNGNQWVRMGYTYFPTDYTSRLYYDLQTGLKYRDPNCARFDRLDGTLPYATDLLWSQTALSHKSGMRVINGKPVPIDAGLNALFKDGHVVYADNPAIFTHPLWYPKEGILVGNLANVFYYTIFDMIEP